MRASLAGLTVWLALALPAAAQAPADDGPVRVIAQPAGEVFVYPRRQAPATVLARNESQLSAQVSATIATIAADVGQRVSAGQVLATLDATDFQLSADQAAAARDGLRARLNLARDQLQRARKLEAGNFISNDVVSQRDADVVSLQADLKGAEAQLAVARHQLDKTVIRAPYEAVVSARQAQLGELTSPGSALFSLVEVGAEQVAVPMPLAAAQTIERQAPARFDFEAGGQRAEVRLLRLSPVVTRTSRTREARFGFAGAPMAAGTDGQLVWRDAIAHVPAEIVVRRASELGVFALEQGTARFVRLPDAQEGRPAPAPTLDARTELVTDGQQRLQAGQPVQLR